MSDVQTGDRVACRRSLRSMTGNRTPSRRDVLQGYFLLPHVVPIIAVLTATAAFAVVAARGWPGAVDMSCLLGAMFGGQLAVGAVNELVDAELDAQSRPSKPIPAGLVSRRGAVTVAVSGLLLMVLLSLRFPPEAFLLCALGTGTGIAYSFWFKHTVWSWVPYVLAIPLIPIWVWTALDAFPFRLLAVYAIGVPAVVSLQIAQSLPDVESDQAAGVKTLAVALGLEHARLACWGLVLLSIILAPVTATWMTPRPEWAWWGSGVSAVLVAINVVVWRVDEHRGTMSAFPLIAVTSTVLGVGWTLAAVGG